MPASSDSTPWLAMTMITPMLALLDWIRAVKS